MSCLCVERASLRGAQSELHFHILHRGSIPNDGERGLGVRRHLRHVAVQGIEGRQRLPVERDDPVSWKNACRCRRSAKNRTTMLRASLPAFWLSRAPFLKSLTHLGSTWTTSTKVLALCPSVRTKLVGDGLVTP
eukprot:scaffold975_cov343-Pinguiococcus_pyrenoidosus.AAC.2